MGHISKTLGIGNLGEKLELINLLAARPKGLTLRECAKNFHSIYQRVLSPFLRGVFLTNPDSVRADIAQKIIRSFLLGRPGVPSGGVGEFSQALESQIEKIELNMQVDEIKEGSVRGNFGVLKCDAVVVATDLTTAAQMLDLGAIPKALSSTTWYHSTTDQLANDKYLALDAKSPLVNSFVISSVAQAYAPAGVNLISSTTLDPISESEVRKELTRIWGRDTRNWDLAARYEIKQSLPLRSDLLELDRNPMIGEGIYIAGDHRNIPSQNGAMKSGRLAALALI